MTSRMPDSNTTALSQHEARVDRRERDIGPYRVQARADLLERLVDERKPIGRGPWQVTLTQILIEQHDHDDPLQELCEHFVAMLGGHGDEVLKATQWTREIATRYIESSRHDYVTELAEKLAEAAKEEA